MANKFIPGAMVSARGREWIVVHSAPPLLALRPLAGGEETTIHTEAEPPPVPAEFPPPNTGKDIGGYASARLLSDAVRLKLKDGAGPFRSTGRLSFEPRKYQYVPLLMALQQSVVRLLIADDVGIGKTVEAGMIAAELLARRDITRFAVLCPPHLCDQWKRELKDKFNIDAETVTAPRAKRLERETPPNKKLFEHYRHTVVSLDYIKAESRWLEFVEECPEFVIIDEAHTRIWRGVGGQQGYRLLKKLSESPTRNMVFLTATPHSGDETGFFNLLALLDEKFLQLETATGNHRRRLREELGRHFVQRTRSDIVRGEYGDNPFRNRESKEIPYASGNTEYGAFMQDALDYCQKAAQRGENRLIHWSVLALMHCVSSSPAAAAAAIKNRIKPDAQADGNISEAEIKRRILDGDEETADIDLEPSAQGAAEKESLDALAKRAEHIAENGGDPKLAALCKELSLLVKDGKNPVVFCRYIATANYVADRLKEKFESKDESGKQKFAVAAVTGEIPAPARLEKVTELGEARRRILVATDCLSEGVNLQEHFDAVVHYDLSWNPTRHQQREGRVDRLGQQSEKISARMLYGRDNPVDGAVLQVIIRKTENIRQQLGVYVPLPEDAESMTEALLKAVLLRAPAAGAKQLSLFSELEEAKIFESALEENIENMKKRRSSIFAQNRIKAADIIPETKEIIAKLGGEETTRRFVRAALNRLGVNVEEAGKTLKVQYDKIACPLLANYLPNGETLLDFQMPGAPKSLRLHRAHPMVRHLAETFFESALLPEPEYVHRAGAYYSRDAKQVATIAIIRMRHQLHTTKKDIQLAEESAVVRITGKSKPTLAEDEEVLLLLDSQPAENIADARRQMEVEDAIKRIQNMPEELNALARRRAQDLLEAHERVRRDAARKGNIASVEKADTTLPPDIIGVYVVLPYAGGSQ